MMMLSYLATRLTEASTWAGIASLLLMMHVSVDPGFWHTITAFGTAFGAMLAYVIPSGATPPTPK